MTQTQSLNCTIGANELDIFNVKLLDTILLFFSCYDIHTFASISKKCSDNVNDLKPTIQSTVDPMIKISTKNNDATCLSLTHQEILFYQPFLTLSQLKWSKIKMTPTIY